jgi:hypothetical protein
MAESAMPQQAMTSVEDAIKADQARHRKGQQAVWHEMREQSAGNTLLILGNNGQVSMTLPGSGDTPGGCRTKATKPVTSAANSKALF